MDERLNNTTFGNGPCTELNACVGNNGPQDNSIYSEGYLKAAQLLLAPLVDARSVENVDTLVFPITFCIRHGLELHLKSAITALVRVRSTVDIDREKLAGAHDIGKLWSVFDEQARKADRRYIPLLDKLESHVIDYAEMDPTGQTFRYPQDRASQKHLTKTPLINLERLQLRLGQLIPLLEKFELLNESLVEEYAQGTYTDRLSRADIELIADRLPCWWNRCQPEFQEAKNQLKEELGVGNKYFDPALEIIKKHQGFSGKMGFDIPLQYLQTQELALFMLCVDRLHHAPRRSSGRRGQVSFEEVAAYSKLKRELIKSCIARIGQSSWAELTALYILGRNCRYSEEYECRIGFEKQDIGRYHIGSSDYYKYVEYVISKTNARYCIEKGLEMLGQYRLLVNMEHMATDVGVVI